MFLSPRQIFASASDAPIVLSRLDCDVYKFIMAQFIWDHGHSDIPVTFGFKMRTKGVKIGNIIPEPALREQLDYLMNLRFTQTELSQLMGMTVANKEGTVRQLFKIPFVAELNRRSLRDTSYELGYLADGTIKLTFSGKWLDVMFWETTAMAIISELYYWHLWQSQSATRSEFSSFYAEMHQRTVRDCMKLRQFPELTFSQFGHRRRHSRMIEVHMQEVFEELIPNQCVAASNVWLSFLTGKNNPKGTNAHELPMVWATLKGNTDQWIQESPHDLVRNWAEYYPELAILLPDTFRTTAFLKDAGADIAHSTTGVRIDSKKEEIAIPEFIEWFKRHGENPRTKTFIPSDGLTADRMIEIYKQFVDQVGVLTFGYGTHATNQINGILPPETGFTTLSMVIKVIEANGRPTVKLSDNPGKHTGIDEAEIARYDRLFVRDGEAVQDIIV
ncbi:MAG: nicotinate phosphoribosyltransferase [Candidatus Parcubacteria bacterium]|jgi:nicotinate phosphoribosyltransferase